MSPNPDQLTYEEVMHMPCECGDAQTLTRDAETVASGCECETGAGASCQCGCGPGPQDRELRLERAVKDLDERLRALETNR